jgi:uncharacterized RDD family membrane protein YckC
MTPEHDYLSDIPVEDNFGYTLASPLLRFGGAIIEGIILYLPLSFLYDGSFYSDNEIFNLEETLFQAGLSCLAGAVFYSLWSGNLGHKILNMKVISAVDGSDQKNGAVGALREGLKSILGTFVIPLIWLLWDRRKQNLYDKITKTLVIMKH